MLTKPVIFGFQGTELTQSERDFFAEHRPFGYILFKRNCQTKAQVKALTDCLREISNNPDIPILIDQEGGRVSRLKAPEWREFPPVGSFLKEANGDIEIAKKTLYENYKNIAKDLREIGVNVNCAPMLDLLIDGSHDIVGDRALGKTTEEISALGRVICEAMLSQGVTPIIKHIPGHGRAKCDSHEDLPIVEESLECLIETDFAPFKNLSDQKMAMTAHIKYSAIDDENPATLSKKMIDIIRNEIGFKGLLMTDDLSMKALDRSFKERVEKSLAAGCDIILHCNGDMGEMIEIAAAL